MLRYTLGEIAHAMRGKLTGALPQTRFEGDVSLDTRTLKEGDLFFALKGPHYDAHDFLEDAFQKGARISVVHKKPSSTAKRSGRIWIVVEDTLRALGRVASHHRRQYAIPVVAITGSCGKTTTKEITSHLLSSRYRVLKNPGTENNFIGVPKALLQLDGHTAAVIEIGTNHKGEIHYLSRVVNPTHAILTVIGNAHLTGFKNVEGVQKEKLSMLEALEDRATVIYNGEDPLMKHSRFRMLREIRAGFGSQNDYYADAIDLRENGTAFRLNGEDMISTPLLGRHNVLNTLLSIGCAASLDVPKTSFPSLMQSFEPPKGRVRYQELNGIYWIDDSYNSNPTSLKAALELFKVYPPRGRKVLVLGDMLELGRRSAIFHREAGQSIAEFSFDLVITVGELSQKILEGAVEKGFHPDRVKGFATSDEAGIFLKQSLKAKDTVMLKGSRGTHMEKILNMFTCEPKGSSDAV